MMQQVKNGKWKMIFEKLFLELGNKPTPEKRCRANALRGEETDRNLRF